MLALPGSVCPRIWRASCCPWTIESWIPALAWWRYNELAFHQEWTWPKNRNCCSVKRQQCWPSKATAHHRSSHHTTEHHRSSHHTTEHNRSSHHTTEHHRSSHHTTEHHRSSHHITEHHRSSHHITEHHRSSHHTTEHNRSSHHTTEHNRSSHHITEHHRTSHHTTEHHRSSHHTTEHHRSSHHTTERHSKFPLSDKCPCDWSLPAQLIGIRIYCANFTDSQITFCLCPLLTL